MLGAHGCREGRLRGEAFRQMRKKGIAIYTNGLSLPGPNGIYRSPLLPGCQGIPPMAQPRLGCSGVLANACAAREVREVPALGFGPAEDVQPHSLSGTQRHRSRRLEDTVNESGSGSLDGGEAGT